jgi:hypothetical protein
MTFVVALVLLSMKCSKVGTGFPSLSVNDGRGLICILPYVLPQNPRQDFDHTKIGRSENGEAEEQFLK